MKSETTQFYLFLSILLLLSVFSLGCETYECLSIPLHVKSFISFSGQSNQDYQRIIQENEELKLQLDANKKSDDRNVSKNTWRFITICLLIVITIGFPLAFFLGYAFAKSDKQPIKNTSSGYLDSKYPVECPKCHWKIDKDASVCPNPDCKTRL